MKAMNIDAPYVNTSEINITLEGISRGKTGVVMA